MLTGRTSVDGQESRRAAQVPPSRRCSSHCAASLSSAWLAADRFAEHLGHRCTLQCNRATPQSSGKASLEHTSAATGLSLQQVAPFRHQIMYDAYTVVDCY
jgi:hypothetical protein